MEFMFFISDFSAATTQDSAPQWRMPTTWQCISSERNLLLPRDTSWRTADSIQRMPLRPPSTQGPRTMMLPTAWPWASWLLFLASSCYSQWSTARTRRAWAMDVYSAVSTEHKLNLIYTCIQLILSKVCVTQCHDSPFIQAISIDNCIDILLLRAKLIIHHFQLPCY